MFGLFGKKKSPEEKPEAAEKMEAQSAEFQDYAKEFLPEEVDIVAVTGANGFGGGKTPESALWWASIGLTAWMEEDGSEIHREPCLLTTLADDRLLDFLRSRTPRDSILKCRVRLSQKGDKLLLLDIPQPGFDPDLKAILDEQKKPVTFLAEGLGTFTLNRQVNWFETEVDWLGASISLVFDQADSRDGCVQMAKDLLAGAEDWDQRVREYAAGELLELANDWAEDAGDEAGEPEAITKEQFMVRMELESIEICADGSFAFWFADGDMFYGHSIHVTGSLENGPDWAQMEG